MPEPIERVNERKFAHVKQGRFGKDLADIPDALKGFFREGLDLLQVWNLGEKVRVKKLDRTTVIRSRWNHDLREFGNAAYRLYKEINDLGPLALGAYALFIGGLGTGVSGCAWLSNKVVDPYSIKDIRVLESRLDERQIEGEKVYRWKVDGVDDRGSRVEKTMYFVNKQAATPVNNIRYGDTVGLPENSFTGSFTNWAAELWEPQSSTDQRYVNSLVLSPAYCEGKVRGEPQVSYNNGGGTLKVFVEGNTPQCKIEEKEIKDADKTTAYEGRELEYAGSRGEIETAAALLKNAGDVTIRFSTSGSAAMLISQGGFYGR